MNPHLPPHPCTACRLQRGLRLLSIALLVASLAGLMACGPHRGPRRYSPEKAAAESAPERDFWQLPALVLQKMGVREGMQVLDLGAGSGYMLPWLSRAVGETGVVWAAEVQPALVSRLEKRIAREGLRNVRVLLSTNASIPLPVPIDRVLLLNTYTELSKPIEMLHSVRLALKPGGRLAVIDYLPFADVPGPALDQRLPLDTVIAEARGAGFVESMQFKVLPRQYFALFINYEELDASSAPTLDEAEAQQEGELDAPSPKDSPASKNSPTPQNTPASKDAQEDQ